VIVAVFATLVASGVAIDARRRFLGMSALENAGGMILTKDRGPGWLRKLVGEKRMRLFEQILKIDFTRVHVTDATLAQLRSLDGALALHLDDTQVTDAALTHVKGLTGLWILLMNGARVTDSGLSNLEKLAGLQILDVSNTAVTDVGMKSLQGLTGLVNLSLK